MIKAESYLTISSPGEGLYKSKGSKFLGFSFPVSREEEIKDRLEGLRRNYHDARHHCYAWRLGPDMELYRFNDDGEPASSAGKPILGQIQSRDLTDVLVVVIRYFGGTLLGVGGLITAYRTAAAEALDKSGSLRKYVHENYHIRFGYESMNTVMKILKETDAGHSEQDFGLACSLKVSVRKNISQRFRDAFEPFPDIRLKYLDDE